MSRRSYGSKKLSAPKARAALAQLLAGCKPEMLPTFTAEGLAGSYNVPEPTAGDMLRRALLNRLGSVSP